jgi:hypothetical protein
MRRVLIVILALTTLAAARDKKTKAQPGPYIFTSKASAQTVKALIVQESLRDGFTLDSDQPLQFRLSKPGQMPYLDAIFVASSACPGMTTKKVWSYTLEELHGTTKVTVEPVWQYPDDYCKTQTQALIWSLPEEIAAFQAMLDKAPASTAQVPAPTPAPVSPAVAPAPAPTPAGDRRPAEAATQNTAQPVPPDQSSQEVARRAQQHAACLELAKDNPSITCK